VPQFYCGVEFGFGKFTIRVNLAPGLIDNF